MVIDPPFITHEVWRAYAQTAHWLLDGSASTANTHHSDVLLTTVRENEPLLVELFGPRLKRQAWRPSIPRLVYQYDTFATWECPPLQRGNAELGEKA